MSVPVSGIYETEALQVIGPTCGVLVLLDTGKRERWKTNLLGVRAGPHWTRVNMLDDSGHRST
jgi:hypothetical protein